MLNKYTLEFKSAELEALYITSQKVYLFKQHNILSGVVSAFFLCNAYASLNTGYTLLGIILLALALLCIVQHIVCQRQKSLKYLYLFCFFNLIPLFQGMAIVFIYKASAVNDWNTTFIMGALQTVYHLAMLINPKFIPNVVIMTVVLILQETTHYCIAQKFEFTGCLLVPMTIFIQVNKYVEIQQRRNQFLARQKQDFWIKTFSQSVEIPYVMVSYLLNDMKFIHVQSDDKIQKEMNLPKSQLVPQILRRMTLIGQNKTLEQILYSYIVKKTLIPSNGEGQFEFQQTDSQKCRYTIKIIEHDRISLTYMLLFKKIPDSGPQECIQTLAQYKKVMLSFCLNQIKTQHPPRRDSNRFQGMKDSVDGLNVKIKINNHRIAYINHVKNVLIVSLKSFPKVNIQKFNLEHMISLLNFYHRTKQVTIKLTLRSNDNGNSDKKLIFHLLFNLVVLISKAMTSENQIIDCKIQQNSICNQDTLDILFNYEGHNLNKIITNNSNNLLMYQACEQTLNFIGPWSQIKYKKNHSLLSHQHLKISIFQQLDKVLPKQQLEQ